MPTREANPAKQKRSTFGLELEAGAREILAHLKEEMSLPVKPIVLPDEVNVKRIRTASGMSQADFARAFHIELRTLQDWEQGGRKPDATSRAYLAVIQRNPNPARSHATRSFTACSAVALGGGIGALFPHYDTLCRAPRK